MSILRPDLKAQVKGVALATLEDMRERIHYKTKLEAANVVLPPAALPEKTGKLSNTGRMPQVAIFMPIALSKHLLNGRPMRCWIPSKKFLNSNTLQIRCTSVVS